MKETSIGSGRVPMVCRQFEPGAVVLADNPDATFGYLIERGVVAVSVAAGSSPAACVALLGPGTLIRGGDGGTVYSALVPVVAQEIPVASLRRISERQPTLSGLLSRQLQQRLVQTQSVAACNAQHSLSQRCVRWLLRLRALLGDEIPVTHAVIADMMGVRRAGVSLTLEGLRQEGILRQVRGRIAVLDADRLADRACACQDELADPDGRISAHMLSWAAPGAGRPRRWIEQQLETQHPITSEDDQIWARRQATLQVCQLILARGYSVLGSEPVTAQVPATRGYEAS